jgi:hypothetical protein
VRVPVAVVHLSAQVGPALRLRGDRVGDGHCLPWPWCRRDCARDADKLFGERYGTAWWTRRWGPSGLRKIGTGINANDDLASSIRSWLRSPVHRRSRVAGKKRVSAPRGAGCSDGGGRPPSPRRRSGGVKLEAA